jgi:tetratricopeptide (TPR) repeat protein
MKPHPIALLVITVVIGSGSLAAFWSDTPRAKHGKGKPQEVKNDDQAEATLTAKRMYALAQVSYDEHKYQDALETLHEAVRLDPSSAPARLLRALTYFQMGKTAEAADDFSVDIQFEPNHGAAYFLRGQCYLKLARYQSAVTDFQRTADLDPDLREQAMAWLHKAQTASAQSRSPKTISASLDGPGA